MEGFTFVLEKFRSFVSGHPVRYLRGLCGAPTGTYLKRRMGSDECLRLELRHPYRSGFERHRSKYESLQRRSLIERDF